MLIPHKLIDRFMWVRSHIFSRALFSDALPRFSTGIFPRIRDCLTQFRVPRQYPWTWHQTANMVYLRLSVNRPATTALLYVGATRETVQGREATRRRKFIQLARKKLSHFEPALRVFHRKRDFYHGITLALHHDSDFLSLLATEAALIRTIRPALNYPWVQDLLKSLRIKQTSFRLPQARTGNRFTSKCQALIRRRHGLYHQHFLNNKQVFLSLYRLGSDSLEKFEESRRLRSHCTPLQELYLRCRLVSMIDEPFKTRAVQQLRLIMEFRKGHMPPTNVPLRLPPLAHDLAQEVHKVLRDIVMHERVNFPPLHLPSCKMIEVKARPWSRTVFNYRPFIRSWKPGQPEACNCTRFTASTTWTSGHLFAHVRLIFPRSPLATLNLNDTCFLPTSQWKRVAVREVQRWCNRWRLPSRVRSGLLQWVSCQCQLHQQTVFRGESSLHSEVLRDLRCMRGLVFTPADHFPFSLHVACPFAFHSLLDTTFLDETVFQRCSVGASSIVSNLKLRFQHTQRWSQRYGWGCQWNAPLPEARILPKPNKDFQKARPIIACDRCWHARLTTFLAKGIFQIMLVVFPTGSTFNVLSVQQAVRMMWHSMMAYPADEPTTMKQQDLIGFFNSVPHDRILHSLNFALQLLEDHWHKPWRQQSLQVSVRSKDPHFRVFRGRRRFAARNTKTIYLEDLPALIAFMLRSSFFQCGCYTFKQIQGASMGSALAPVLCTLVASTIEFVWLRNFRTVLYNIGFQQAARYADNRIFHFHVGIRRNPWLRLLFHLEFYGVPILLEDVLSENFLGTTCSVTQGTITVVQPAESTAIRTLISVGRREHVLSGFAARIRTILRLTRPMRLIRPQVEDLIEIYRGQGFSRSTLVQYARHLLKSVGIQLRA